MEHNGFRYPTCKCDGCLAEHARHAREYRKVHTPPSRGKLNAELAELRAFKAGVLAAQAARVAS